MSSSAGKRAASKQPPSSDPAENLQELEIFGDIGETSTQDSQVWQGFSAEQSASLASGVRSMLDEHQQALMAQFQTMNALMQNM